MLITATEGEGFRYEVTDRADGYVVSTRDVDTGEVDAGETRLFRTAAVAFAYAEMLAAFNRYAAARILGDEGQESLQAELEAQLKLFEELSERLRDVGFHTDLFSAWVDVEPAQARPTLH